MFKFDALEKKLEDDVVHGEIETAHPDYPGSQDTFYVDTIKGVGRIFNMGCCKAVFDQDAPDCCRSAQ